MTNDLVFSIFTGHSNKGILTSTHPSGCPFILFGEREEMIKVYFKEIVEYYDNGCSCCQPMETTNYTLVDYHNNLPEDLHNKLIDSCTDTSEQYRCLVDTSYVFSDTSLEYYEYVDRCYNLFNYEQMEEVLKQDGVEVVFL